MTATACELLAECARVGATVTAAEGRLRLEHAGGISEDLRQQLKQHREELLALLEPGSSGRSVIAEAPRHSPQLAALAEVFDDCGPVEVLPCSPRRWARDGAAGILRRLRRHGKREAARDLHDAWEERLAVLIADGQPMARAEAVALEELERLAAERGHGMPSWHALAHAAEGSGNTAGEGTEETSTSAECAHKPRVCWRRTPRGAS